MASIVCYLTGLSHVDPVENELFLGRFLNEELTALPDIDLDFPRDIRDVLIPRVHERYGRDRCALVAAFATYRVRSAVRDFAKVLGLPPGEIERLARRVDPGRAGQRHLPGGSRRLAALEGAERSAATPLGLPRHVTQHPGGMVISTQPLIDIARSSRRDGGAPDGSVGQGVVRRRGLPQDRSARPRDALRRRALRRADRAHAGERIDLSRIPFDDREVYSCIQDADTVGVFQIEERAQMQMLKRTRPESLDDLTVQVPSCGRGRSSAAPCIPTWSARSERREDPAYASRTTIPPWRRCSATRSGRSSSRTR